MKKLSTNFTIFILFFGVSLLEAVQTQNWLKVTFWLAIAFAFLWPDLKEK